MRSWVVVMLGGWGIAAGAQTTERIGRVELSNGYVSVEARRDGLMVISAVSTLRFDFGSGVFSPRTVTAWLDGVARTVDSVRKVPGARIGSTAKLFSADRVAMLELTFELSPTPMIAVARLSRADGIALAVSGTEGDSSFTALLGFLRTAAARTMTLTLASPDSARAYLSDAELTGRATPRDSAIAHVPEKWGTTDRLFVVAGTAGLFGIAGAYVNGKLIGCKASEFCQWSLNNPGFSVGSIAGASLGGLMFSGGGRCRMSERIVRSLGAAMVGGISGAMMAASGKDAGLSVMPIGQAILTDIAIRRCRSS